MTGKPESTPPRGDSEAPDGFLRDVFRRVMETGAKSLTPENLRQAARELRLPKEVLQQLLGQIEEGKSHVYRAVTQEVRRFLEDSNLADEIAKALTRLIFEAKIEVRFRPNETADRESVAPRVSAQVDVKQAQPKGSEPPNTAVGSPKGTGEQ